MASAILLIFLTSVWHAVVQTFRTGHLFGSTRQLEDDPNVAKYLRHLRVVRRVAASIVIFLPVFATLAAWALHAMTGITMGASFETPTPNSIPFISPVAAAIGNWAMILTLPQVYTELFKKGRWQPAKIFRCSAAAYAAAMLPNFGFFPVVVDEAFMINRPQGPGEGTAIGVMVLFVSVPVFALIGWVVGYLTYGGRQ